MTRIDPRVIHVIRLMERHRAAPRSVDSLARAVNVSASYLTRLFRSQLGLSPAQYDKHARLANARDLVIASRLSVREITAAVGWADPSHFCRAFKQHYGVSPGQLRKQSATESRLNRSAPAQAASAGRDRRGVLLR